MQRGYALGDLKGATLRQLLLYCRAAAGNAQRAEIEQKRRRFFHGKRR